MSYVDASQPRTERVSRFEIRCETDRSYYVLASSGLLDTARSELREVACGRRILVVTTPTVARLYGPTLGRYLEVAAVPHELVVAPVGEDRKTMEVVLEICSAANAAGLRRGDLLLALGGGVCCDVVGLAASLVRRGIPYACLPTTLVAQVDAAVGLKSGVNFEGRKNYLGSFRPP